MVRVERVEDSDQNQVDFWYKRLMRDIKEHGTAKEDRTGTGTLSVFGRIFRHQMADGFPLLTTKKMYTKGVIVELLWFLDVHMQNPHYARLGRTNIQWLLHNDCNIWVGDAYKRYVKFAGMMEEPDMSILVDDPSMHMVRLLTREEFIESIKKDDAFALKFGDLGPIYGHQWNSFGGYERLAPGQVHDVLCEKVKTLDEVFEALEEEACEMPIQYPSSHKHIYPGSNQIATLISQLIMNPDSRRLMVTAWNPTDLSSAILPPCHYGFQCYTRKLSQRERVMQYYKRNGKTFFDSSVQLDLTGIPERELSLSWNQRSVDVPLGLPFNIASYAFLLEMIAKVVNMVPGELIGYLGDCHIYNNQMKGVDEQLKNLGKKLPTLSINTKEFLHDYQLDDFKIIGYESAGKIDYPLSN